METWVERTQPTITKSHIAFQLQTNIVIKQRTYSINNSWDAKLRVLFQGMH